MAVRLSKLISINEEREPDTIIRTFILFSQTSREVLKYVDAHLYREAGLSTIQLITLQSLAANGGAMTPSRIAEWTQTERHNITTLIQRMKKGGLVTIEPNSRDRRVVDVFLTAKGREVLNQTMPVAKKVVAQTMLSMTEEDAILLEKLLKRIRQNARAGLERVFKQA